LAAMAGLPERVAHILLGGRRPRCEQSSQAGRASRGPRRARARRPARMALAAVQVASLSRHACRSSSRTATFWV
jgi:hypothetical protein